MQWIDFHGLFGRHVRTSAGITKSLSFHNTFHVSRPSIFTSNQNTWRFNDTVRDNNF